MGEREREIQMDSLRESERERFGNMVSGGPRLCDKNNHIPVRAKTNMSRQEPPLETGHSARTLGGCAEGDRGRVLGLLGLRWPCLSSQQMKSPPPASRPPPVAEQNGVLSADLLCRMTVGWTLGRPPRLGSQVQNDSVAAHSLQSPLTTARSEASSAVP